MSMRLKRDRKSLTKQIDPAKLQLKIAALRAELKRMEGLYYELLEILDTRLASPFVPYRRDVYGLDMNRAGPSLFAIGDVVQPRPEWCKAMRPSHERPVPSAKVVAVVPFPVPHIWAIRVEGDDRTFLQYVFEKVERVSDGIS